MAWMIVTALMIVMVVLIIKMIVLHKKKYGRIMKMLIKIDE